MDRVAKKLLLPVRLPSARLDSPRSRQAWRAWEPLPLFELRVLLVAFSPLPVLLVFLVAVQPDWPAHAAPVRLPRAKSLVRELVLNA